jgi:hypothetical protein
MQQPTHPNPRPQRYVAQKASPVFTASPQPSPSRGPKIQSKTEYAKELEQQIQQKQQQKVQERKASLKPVIFVLCRMRD